MTVEIGRGGYYIGTTSIANITAEWDNHTEWLVSQQEGVDLIFQVVDASGKTGYVQNVKVGAGDSNCLENSASNSSLTASSGSTGSATATASSAAISEAVGGTSGEQALIRFTIDTNPGRRDSECHLHQCFYRCLGSVSCSCLIFLTNIFLQRFTLTLRRHYQIR